MVGLWLGCGLFTEGRLGRQRAGRTEGQRKTEVCEWMGSVCDGVMERGGRQTVCERLLDLSGYESGEAIMGGCGMGTSG